MAERLPEPGTMLDPYGSQLPAQQEPLMQQAGMMFNGKDIPPGSVPFAEIGTTGLRQYSGYVREELLRDLQGSAALRIYRQMAENDAMVGAILFAIEMLARQVAWRFDAADTTPLAQQHAALVTQMLFEDMALPWPLLLSEILSFLPMGFSYHEVIWKRRQGLQPPAGAEQDPTWHPSRYDDGLIGWAGWPIRAQETRLRWQFDAQRHLQGMIQQDPLAGRTVFLPLDKALLFRAFSWKENPEGRSVLRTAYRAWYRKQHIENIEGIGIERDLAGLPLITGPQELFYGNLSPEQQAVLQYLQTMGASIRKDEQAYVLLPAAYDEQNNPLFTFKLVSSGGARQIDTNQIIQREDVHLCQTVLADVLMVGHTGTGARAVAEPKTDLLSLAINGFLDAICGVVNRDALPKLWQLNAFPPETMPQLTHGEVKNVNLNDFSAMVLRYSQAGFDLAPDWAHIRMVSGFPVQDASEIEEGAL